METLFEQLRTRAVDLGARLFGAAELAQAEAFIVEQGGEFLSSFPRSISVGISLHDAIVDRLDDHKEISVARTYDYLYDTVNRALDRIAYQLSVLLTEDGFKTLQIPASDTLDREKSLGLFSHKLAAHLSGLGWIGPNCLLITPEFGPRVRWVTILTDAPLTTGKPIPNQCGDCRQCVDECPPKAFSGRPFDPDEHRDMRFNTRRCIDYRAHLGEKVTGARVCGMCIFACPFGNT